MRAKLIISLVCLMPLWVGAEETLDLMEAYHKAQQYDAKLRAATSENNAQQEEIDLAFSQFLPQARISAYKGRASTDREFTTVPGSQHFVYDSQNYSFTVRQSIFNKANFAGYNQALAVAAKSDATLQKERMSLMSRVTGSYLDVLLNTESSRYTETQKTSVAVQLEQAKRRYKTGFGTVTEVSEAEANYQGVIAKQLEFLDALEYSKRILENLTGIYVDNYLTLDPTKLALTKPTPTNIEDWITLALKSSPDIQAALNDLDAANQQVVKNSSGHYPTLDLVASRAHTESDAANTIGSKYDTDSIGIQLNIPIYSGGYTSASVRQALARKEQAQEKLSGIQRDVSSGVRKYYGEIFNGIARIQALESSVKSYETALIGTQKSFSVGVRSNVDVLNAQEKLYSSKRDLAKERYTLIYNRLQLKLNTGVLTESDIQESSNILSMQP